MTISPVATGTPVPGTSTSTVVPEPVDDDAAPTASGVEAAAPETKLPGVLRLLEAGHFRGVADVRLRIVHAEKLAAVAMSAAEAPVRDAAAALSMAVAERLAAEEVPAEAGADGPSGAEFAAAINTAVDDYFRAGAPDAEALAASLTSVFDAFVLELARASGVDAVPVDDAAAVREAEVDAAQALDTSSAPTAEPTTGLLADLEQLFTDGLQAILAALAEAARLPPLSEARGNGRAYEKFLAEYLALAPAAEAPAPADGIDVEA